MSVSLMLHHKLTGDLREIPIASQSGFVEGWLPICERLGLVWVPEFTGGALTRVPKDLIPEITRELELMLAEVKGNTEGEWITERINYVLTAIAEVNPAEWEYSFG